MRKTLIIINIAIAIILTGGFIYLMTNDDWSFDFSMQITPENLNKEKLVTTKKENITNIEEIDFSAAPSSVVIEQTDGDEIVVEQYSKNKEKAEHFALEKNSNKIQIKESIKKGITFNFLNISSRMHVFKIYIPKNYNGSLTIKTVSGDIIIDGNHTLENVYLKSISGEIEQRGNIIAQKFEAKTISGEIDGINTDSKIVKLESTSGEISAQRIYSKTTKLKTISGDIDVSDSETSYEASSTSGEIKLYKTNITGDSKIKTISGYVEVELTSNTNCIIEFKTISGDLEFPDGTNFGEDPYNKLNIKTTSGEIKVRK